MRIDLPLHSLSINTGLCHYSDCGVVDCPVAQGLQLLFSQILCSRVQFTFLMTLRLGEDLPHFIIIIISSEVHGFFPS